MGIQEELWVVKQIYAMSAMRNGWLQWVVKWV
jgi:hypothetical protein